MARSQIFQDWIDSLDGNSGQTPEYANESALAAGLAKSGVGALPGGGGAAFVGCRLLRTNSQTLNAGTNALQWNFDEIDTDNFHDTVTNTDRIMIPAGKGGIYCVGCSVGLSSMVADKYADLLVQLDGSTGIADSTVFVSIAGYVSLSATGIITTTPGSMLQASINHNNTTAITTVPNPSVFWAYKIG